MSEEDVKYLVCHFTLFLTVKRREEKMKRLKRDDYEISFFFFLFLSYMESSSSVESNGPSFLFLFIIMDAFSCFEFDKRNLKMKL